MRGRNGAVNIVCMKGGARKSFGEESVGIQYSITSEYLKTGQFNGNSIIERRFACTHIS